MKSAALAWQTGYRTGIEAAGQGAGCRQGRSYHVPPEQVFDYWASTTIGPVRPVNSDACLAAPLSKRSGHEAAGHLFLVADGIGQEPGRCASAAAVESIRQYLFGREHELASEQNSLLPILQSAVRSSHARIQALAPHGGVDGGFGTTLTLACVLWPRLFLVHVGDSRCYLLRNGKLRQLTTDHTFAQRLFEAGVFDAEQAARTPWRHVLWNVVGGSIDSKPETCECHLLSTDRLLLCSDGISGTLSLEELQQHLIADRPAQDLCHALVEHAMSAGSRDNLTAVVVRFFPQN